MDTAENAGVFAEEVASSMSGLKLAKAVLAIH